MLGWATQSVGVQQAQGGWIFPRPPWGVWLETPFYATAPFVPRYSADAQISVVGRDKEEFLFQLLTQHLSVNNAIKTIVGLMNMLCFLPNNFSDVAANLHTGQPPLNIFYSSFHHRTV